MSHYQTSSLNKNDHYSVERQQNAVPDQRSPMSIRRTPTLISKNKINMRKLTNSLFEDNLFTETCNVIKEEEKERDEQD